MAKYLIKYLDGDSEEIEGGYLEPSGADYVVWKGDGSALAYIPRANVRSAVRLNDEGKP
ncbi:hypothetical protein [Streptomyces sp. DT18]